MMANTPQKTNYHLMSSDMWLGAEIYLASIWCITVSAPCNPQRCNCNYDELELELPQNRDWFYMMSPLTKGKLIFCGDIFMKVPPGIVLGFWC
jgi:hypothetical protein